MDIYYYGMDDFLKSITIESSMHITTVTVAQPHNFLNPNEYKPPCAALFF